MLRLSDNRVISGGVASSVIALIILEVYLYFFCQSSSGGLPFLSSAINNTSTHAPSDPCGFSPYNSIGVKDLLLNPIFFWIHEPLAASFLCLTGIASSPIFAFLTPNMISIFHVFLAFLACNCIHLEPLHVRRIGVVLFHTKNWFDALDGKLARARSPQSINSKFGYWMDGACDAFGVLFLISACILYLYWNPSRNWNYMPLGVSVRSKDKPGESKLRFITLSGNSTLQKYLAAAAAPIWYGFLLLLSSMFWNRHILAYRELLENRSTWPIQLQLFGWGQLNQIQQADAIHQPMMWLVVEFWRLMNPDTMTDYLLAAIFFDRIKDYLNFAIFFGTAILFCGIFIGEIQLFFLQTSIQP